MNRNVIVWLSLCCIWGTTWLAIKLGLDFIPPFMFAGLRFLIAGTVLTLLALIQKRKLPETRREWDTVWQSGLLTVGFNYGAIFWAEQHVSSGLAAVLNALVPLFGILFAHRLIAGEAMTRKKVLGVTVGIAGVGIIFMDNLHSEGALAAWGSALIVVGAAAVAFASILVKLHAKNVDSVVLSAGQMVVSVPALFATGFLMGEHPSTIVFNTTSILALLHLAIVGSCVAFVLFYWLMKQIEVTKVLSLVLVIPIIAVTIGALVHGEEVTWRLILGGATIIVGVGTIVINPLALRSKKDGS